MPCWPSSSPARPPTPRWFRRHTQQARVLQRAANLSDVYDKTVNLEAKIDLLNERLIRVEQKIDAMNRDMEVVLRVLKRIDPQNQR